MEGKRKILMYAEWIHTFEALTDEEAGALIKHLLRYVNDRDPAPPNRMIEVVFAPIKVQLKADLAAWNEVVAKRVIAGAARWQQEPAAPSISKHVQKKPKIPSKEEFLAYCNTLPIVYKDYEFSLSAKYDTFVADGWKDGHGKKITNWKNTIRNIIPHLKPMQITTKSSPKQVMLSVQDRLKQGLPVKDSEIFLAWSSCSAEQKAKAPIKDESNLFGMAESYVIALAEIIKNG